MTHCKIDETNQQGLSRLAYFLILDRIWYTALLNVVLSAAVSTDMRVEKKIG